MPELLSRFSKGSVSRGGRVVVRWHFFFFFSFFFFFFFSTRKMVFKTRAFSRKIHGKGSRIFSIISLLTIERVVTVFTRKRRLNIVYDKCARQCNLN